MTLDFDSNDVQLMHGEIRQLQNADALAGFLARLHYAIDVRTTIDSYAQVGLDSAYLRQEIKHVELLATDPHDQEIKIYLLEVRSLTAALRNAIARAFRDRPELALVILTKDYESFEFVILLRELAQNTQRGAAIRQMLRPVPLTINRLHVSDVALRVLKRFTMTEPDALYQWDKLRSAFVLAEWSEQYFNNRALFSDYYLKHRLTDAKLNVEWDEQVLPIGRKINPLLKTARQQLTDQPLATMHKQFYAPILADLGFVLQAVADEPSYRYDLALPNNPQPVAAFFGYVWNRNLDDQDSQRDPATPLIIPGAEVVSTLEAGTVPWVIVSNGKYWRLYSTTASNKATNYYEVDLEEAFGAQDALVALKYWWLFFRAQAFGGFLERLLKQSAEYAKGLGERLKDRVFTEIFPQFAQGFIADMRRQGSNDLSEQQLNPVFEGTLTFLYRLMFVLYAESLDLLPLNEHNGYRERSLYMLKREIAEIAGSLLDQRAAKLQAHYSDTSTTLYQRILDLCGVIDRGSPDLNMPTYNGGLFSATSTSGEFLQRYAVPDRYLALGLDRLARDLDDRSQALVLIDFKSLGVRQLGSIYEGLLEFKLHIASERLAVTKEKAKEVYQPAAKVAKPLAIIEQGMAYLVNDKKERKATGSYYTPDYIVKYIVQQTVGAVLDEKFKALAPRLHEAQKQYRNYANLVAARAKSSKRSENPAVFWTDPNSAMGQLLDDCLNLRVLDPAMGSGHFLVEVVDFISNRLIHFLNAWSENPVWAMIDRTRSEIVADMERQGVTIDPERLTRVALLKRAVLKRCIYGVDLNAMAVELAKVSLWLDAFTLGAPLSFLDHHLKHGNSLIGARVAEVQTYLDVGGSQSHMLAGNEFAGLSLATDLMRQVSFLSDNTVEQAQQSAVAFRDADQHLAPFKRMLDVYTSRWFGNQPAKKSKSDWVNIFLRMPSIKPWLHDATAKLDDSLIPASQIGQIALEAASSKHFFHWELEFPEIFFAPSTPGGQDVQLNPNGGFDAVVGNPPYSSNVAKDVSDYIKQEYEYTNEGYKNLALHLLEIGFISTNNNIGFIVPKSLTYSDGWWSGVSMLWDNLTYALDVSKAWDEVLLEMVIVIADKSKVSANLIIGQFENKSIQELEIKKIEWIRFKILPTSTNEHELPIAQSVWQNSIPMGEITINRRGKGFQRSCIDEGKYVAVRGDSIERFISTPNAFFSESFFDLNKSELQGYLRDCIFAQNIVAHVTDPIDKIIVMASLSDRVSIPLDTVNNFYLTSGNWKYKSLLSIINSYFISWYTYRFIYNRAIRTMHFDEGYTSKIPIPRIDFTTEPSERERLTQIAIDLYTQKNDNNVLTLVNTLFTAENPIQSNPIQSNPIQSNPIQSNPIQSNPIQSNPIQSNPIRYGDVVHDLLAYLAQHMIDLNKAKQQASKRFLDWLENQLRIQPKKGETGLDSLTGKTIIQGYLGDYQKGQRAVSWSDFWYRLQQNRNRFAANLSDIEASIAQAYRQSLEELLPIKADLARTDALIDKIVYRLYGLSAAEIELIERPQYEQALSEAKANVLKELGAATSDEQTDAVIDKIAEEILPAAERFFERVEPISIEATLDAALPDWRNLPPDIPTFLRTGEYSLLTDDETMDFSIGVIPFTKAVETLLHEAIFKPFRDESGYGANECRNDFLAEFMLGKRHLTLGNYPIILRSSKEQALRSFVSQRFGNRNVFGAGGLVEVLNNQAMLKLRNKAAHDEVIPRSEAEQLREWALQLLRI